MPPRPADDHRSVPSPALARLAADRAPEPSLAERARTLVEGATSGVLATLDPVRFTPYVAAVPVTVDGAGNPVLVVPNLDPHVSRAWREPRAGIALGATGGEVPTTRRPVVALSGVLQAVPGLHQLDLEPRFLAAHPDARDRVISLDCSWFRLVADEVRIDAGGHRVGWVPLDDYRTAEPDPVAPDADALLERLLRIDLLGLARGLTARVNARDALPLDVDRYGCELRLTLDTPGGRATADVRLPFPERLDDPADVVPTLVLMLRNLPPVGGDADPAADRADDTEPADDAAGDADPADDAAGEPVSPG